MKIRPLAASDEALLWPFLMLAAHESELSVVQENSQLARYVTGWGRSGDSGFVTFEEDNTPIGAAWLRMWPHEEKGFGWVADDVPELAMAVVPMRREQGIGTLLLKEVLKSAHGNCRALSLSVREDNPAVRLYERVGFSKVLGSEMRNRAGGVSYTMSISIGCGNRSRATVAINIRRWRNIRSSSR